MLVQSLLSNKVVAGRQRLVKAQALHQFIVRKCAQSLNYDIAKMCAQHRVGHLLKLFILVGIHWYLVVIFSREINKSSILLDFKSYLNYFGKLKIVLECSYWSKIFSRLKYNLSNLFLHYKLIPQLKSIVHFFLLSVFCSNCPPWNQYTSNSS